MRIFELKPLFENVKSYYRKATVCIQCVDYHKATIRLISFDSVVLKCTLTRSNDLHIRMVVKGGNIHKWSTTTARHIKGILNQLNSNTTEQLDYKALKSGDVVTTYVRTILDVLDAPYALLAVDKTETTEI